jgi:hypothetical protein
MVAWVWFARTVRAAGQRRCLDLDSVASENRKDAHLILVPKRYHDLDVDAGSLEMAKAKATR